MFNPMQTVHVGMETIQKRVPLGTGCENIGQTAIRYDPLAKNWDRTKTAVEHGIRFNMDKMAQERTKSASGGDRG